MPRLAVPLSDLKCRTAKPRDRAYKLFDGGGMGLKGDRFIFVTLADET